MVMRVSLDTEATLLRNWLRAVPLWKWPTSLVSIHFIYLFIYGYEDLIPAASFSVYGSLPSQSQLADWEFAILQHSALPQGVLVRLSLSLVENAE